MPARAKVLFDRASRVLNRHVPAAEIDHTTAHLAMDRIQRCLFKFWSDGSHACFRLSLKSDSIKVTAKTGLSRKLTREVRCVKRVNLQVGMQPGVLPWSHWHSLAFIG